MSVDNPAENSDKGTGGILTEVSQLYTEGCLEGFLKESLKEFLEVFLIQVLIGLIHKNPLQEENFLKKKIQRKCLNKS